MPYPTKSSALSLTDHHSSTCTSFMRFRKALRWDFNGEGNNMEEAILCMHHQCVLLGSILVILQG